MKRAITCWSTCPNWNPNKNSRKAFQGFADKKIDLDEFQAQLEKHPGKNGRQRKGRGHFCAPFSAAYEINALKYVKDIPQATLVDNAIRGIFGSLNEKVPTA